MPWDQASSHFDINIYPSELRHILLLSEINVHVNVWQKPLQYCKVISLQLIKIREKIKRKKRMYSFALLL